MHPDNHQLKKGFNAPAAYQQKGYRFLPFKFIPLNQDQYVLTNLVGEHVVLGKSELKAFTDNSLSRTNSCYLDLKAGHFLIDGDFSSALEILAAKYRTKQARLAEFTTLHIFVVTLRCDHSCQYCQVSRVSEDRSAYDMSAETASKAVELLLQSPSKHLKVEFQGGESLLNFEVIKQVVLEVEEKANGRCIEFIIASNLSFLTDEILSFAGSHRIAFSCSLDGPPELHNKNRPRRGNDSHQKTIESIQKIRATLGHEAVSALMTTTMESLEMPERIIDEYLKQGFNSIFLRWISPFGFAVRSGTKIGYDVDRFLNFYKRGMEYIFRLNLEGTFFREQYSSIILQKILTPFGTGYVDLQSPSGLGLSVLVYNYDGDVYASDESRMLAEMNDFRFRLGNVHHNSYREIFLESPLLEIVFDTVLEGIPGCSECAFSPYCGTDPVFNHVTQGDVVGHRPTSSFCKRNMDQIRYLLEILEENSARTRILKSWIQ